MARAAVLLALSLLVVLAGWHAGAQPAAAAAPPAVTMTAAGPSSLIWPAPSYTITVTVVNSEPTPVSGLVLTTNIAYWQLSGPTECAAPITCTTSQITLSTIPAGATVPYVFSYYPPLGYGPLHHTFTLTDASQNAVASATQDVDVVLPPTVADWQVSVSDAVGTGGLGARHRITATNLGPADATGVVIHDRLDAEQTFLSAAPSQGTCSPTPAGTQIEIICSIGSLPAHATVTVDVDVKLFPAPHRGQRERRRGDDGDALCRRQPYGRRGRLDLPRPVLGVPLHADLPGRLPAASATEGLRRRHHPVRRRVGDPTRRHSDPERLQARLPERDDRAAAAGRDRALQGLLQRATRGQRLGWKRIRHRALDAFAVRRQLLRFWATRSLRCRLASRRTWGPARRALPSGTSSTARRTPSRSTREPCSGKARRPPRTR